MNIQIFGTNKGFDTKKAERFFKERKIKFQMVDLGQKGFSRGELQSILRAVGGLEKLIDPNAKDAASLAYLAFEEDKLQKLLENPRLCRQPVVRNGQKATVGYCPEIWETWE